MSTNNSYEYFFSCNFFSIRNFFFKRFTVQTLWGLEAFKVKVVLASLNMPSHLKYVCMNLKVFKHAK